ncbi:MAG TPA: ion channel [Bryobacteraceae bacterium]|nr:ion channel [Bryobacteraceae bacterium]
MQPRQDFDPGLTQQVAGELRRAINPDGSFNVHKTGLRWRDLNLYLYLIETSWSKFFLVIFTGFLLLNAAFAALYLMSGTELVSTETGLDRYGTAFFFSVHTLTTVGYGDIYPKGLWPNFLSAVEAMIGLLSFALATGLLFGRFSKPSARIKFTDNMVVAPYKNITSLQFRIANKRKNVLMELEARILFMTVRRGDGPPTRDYADLELERRNVYFLPLSWTIVHPIDSKSPLFGLTAEDLAKQEAEFLILIRAFDNTFSQTVHARFSYRHDELIWNAKFESAFFVNNQGDLVLELDRLSDLKTL